MGERFLVTAGPPRRDLDVVVGGAADRRALRAANRELEGRLDQPVQVTAVGAEGWESGSTAFVQTAKAKPHVVVLDNRASA